MSLLVKPRLPLVSFEEKATADGAADGSTLICVNLTTRPDYDGNQIIITSGPYTGQARGIVGDTTGGTVNPHRNFSGQITRGTGFVIAALRTVSVEVAGLVAGIDEKPEWGEPNTGTHTTAGPGEEVIVETDLHDPFQFWMHIFLNNMAGGDAFIIRVYVKDNSGVYQLKDEQSFAGAQAIKVYEINGIYGDDVCDIKVTIEHTAGADRAFDYRWNVKKEV